MGGVPEDVSWLFWESDFRALDTHVHEAHILPRVLEFGGLAEVRWAIDSYGLDEIHAFLRDRFHPELSERTLTFWRAVFRAKDERWTSELASRKDNCAPWID